MSRIIGRLQGSVNDVRNWVIPLSGGHDSRIIANFLHKGGLKNVICFSYGVANNLQSEISKEVAAKLRFPWHFVEYTESKWGNLHSNGLFDEYVDFAFQGVSAPHLQDFLAVYELKNRGIIKSGDVFLPGHTLDFITGGHFNELDLECRTKEDALKRAEVRHCRSGIRITDKVIKDLSVIYDESCCSNPSSFQEYTNWQERQAKYIVNSCRVYEFFGFDFRLPFWDREIIDFFLQIEPSQRLRRNLFLSKERQGILLDCLAKTPFEDEFPRLVRKKTVRQRLKRWLPNFLGDIFPGFLAKKRVEPEGFNQMFVAKGKLVEHIIGPSSVYPAEAASFIRTFTKRYPYQVNPLILTMLFAVRRATKCD